MPLENKEVKLDESVTLSCELSKSGQDVTWLKNNVPLCLSDGRYDVVRKDCSHELHIVNVSLEDEAEYQARAGDLECCAKVTVTGQFQLNTY